MALTNAGESYRKTKVSVSNNFDESNNIDIELLKRVEKWQSVLEILHWKIICEPIDETQVVDDLKGNMPGHEFVGISIDFANHIGTIYHTRPLQDDDIVHELLHVRFPKWSEDEINYWTDQVTKNQKANFLTTSNHIGE